MIFEFSILILGFAGLVISFFGCATVDLRIRQQLEKNGESPNPDEFEIQPKLYSFHNLAEYFDRRRRASDLRIQVDKQLANWYKFYQVMLPVSIGLMMLAFILLDAGS